MGVTHQDGVGLALCGWVLVGLCEFEGEGWWCVCADTSSQTVSWVSWMLFWSLKLGLVLNILLGESKQWPKLDKKKTNFHIFSTFGPKSACRDITKTDIIKNQTHQFQLIFSSKEKRRCMAPFLVIQDPRQGGGRFSPPPPLNQRRVKLRLRVALTRLVESWWFYQLTRVFVSNFSPRPYVHIDEVGNWHSISAAFHCKTMLFHGKLRPKTFSWDALAEIGADVASKLSWPEAIDLYLTRFFRLLTESLLSSISFPVRSLC